jgi:hypothetical protein
MRPGLTGRESNGESSGSISLTAFGLAREKRRQAAALQIGRLPPGATNFSQP